MMIYLRFVPIIISMTLVLVIMNWLGQRVIDKNDQVFHSAYYDSKWYLMPKELRRMILLVQNNSTKYGGLTAGKMGEVSLESAGRVIN